MADPPSYHIRGHLGQKPCWRSVSRVANDRWVALSLRLSAAGTFFRGLPRVCCGESSVDSCLYAWPALSLKLVELVALVVKTIIGPRLAPLGFLGWSKTGAFPTSSECDSGAAHYSPVDALPLHIGYFVDYGWFGK